MGRHPIWGQVAKAGPVKHPSEVAESEGDEIFTMVRLRGLSKERGLCEASPKCSKCKTVGFLWKERCHSVTLSLFIILQFPQLKGGSLQTPPLSCHLKIFQYVNWRTLALLLLPQH